MTEDINLVSKVLVLESDPACFEKIKAFCDANNLVGLKVQPENAMAVLRSNIDLGGILLSENYNGRSQGGILMAHHIHAIRSELPIFLRRETCDNLDDIAECDRNSISAAYTIDNVVKLESVISEYIFSLSYPNVLVRGIAEITQAALSSQFKGLTVNVAAPYIVRDRLIYGEIFTLIPIEGSWCRGYMMLQTEELALMELVKADHTHMTAAEGFDFRNLNGVLGEITNLVWGSFKNRYLSDDLTKSNHLSQVPIIINNLHRYISFGSNNPQLCFKYTVSDMDSGKGGMLDIYQKFVFNLNWSPEDFTENLTSVQDLMESGELELF
ncbi:MAG: chemotaxis protein CheX [Rhodoferax sp.]|uniref:chemotaxis protein CheX n=1 Tax=Rhodoferax sp. TaxID=50421 RepID=UPI0030172ED2